MFHIILYQPEIPPNTGNIIRLCANTGATLHLIEPLGFFLDEKSLKRAGLDYHEWARVQTHPSLIDCMEKLNFPRIFACTTKAEQLYTTPSFKSEDAFLFGPESKGLPTQTLTAFPPQQKIRIPMQIEARSLNLANAVSIIVYEAWRQLEFSLKA